MSIPRIKPLLALCRVSNLPTVWMNVLTAALLSGVPADAPQSAFAIALLAFALSCFYCGGMALNDLCDLQHDRLHQPFRPIPAGRIGMRQARMTMGLLFVAGMAGLLLAPHRNGVAAGLLLLAVIWIYDNFHKAYSGAVLVMASARMLVFLVVSLGLTGAAADRVWFAAGMQAVFTLTLTIVARREARMPAGRYDWPVIPWMIAAMPILDGAVLASLIDVRWLAAGITFGAATRLGQCYVRGD